MAVKTVWAVYFSATGTTEKIVETVAVSIANSLKADLKKFDFTLPAARENPLVFQEDDLVVFGTPVYAGRVPNVLLPYLSGIRGNGATAVPIVLFGNRNYDDALIELRDILDQGGLHPIAAGAFSGEHSFSYVLGKGRPDQEDFNAAKKLAAEVVKKATSMSYPIDEPLEVNGTPAPYRGYYQPRDRKGEPVDIRKVKPLTGEACDDCKICAEVCPMGSILYDNVREYTGICIKCGACIKKCPKQAKYYDDAGYLYHQRELEEGFARRAEPELFY